MKNKILYVGLILAFVLGVASFGMAYSGPGSVSTVIENMHVENWFSGVPDLSGEQTGELKVGISTSDNFSAADITATDDLTVTDDATIGGDLTVTGSADVGEFTQGGGVYQYATSTGTTVLTEAELLAYNYIEFMVNTGSTAALTLPATSTMTTLLANAGDSRSWLIHNATSSTMALTITAGTGIDLIGVTTNDDVIDQTEYSQLDCYRQPDTDVTCVTSELLHVD